MESDGLTSDLYQSLSHVPWFCYIIINLVTVCILYYPDTAIVSLPSRFLVLRRILYTLNPHVYTTQVGCRLCQLKHATIVALSGHVWTIDCFVDLDKVSIPSQCHDHHNKLVNEKH